MNDDQKMWARLDGIFAVCGLAALGCFALTGADVLLGTGVFFAAVAVFDGLTTALTWRRLGA